MELQDPKVCFLYDQLRVKTIICLNDYINSGRGTLAELKERFRQTLPEEERRRVRTVKNLVDTLEEQGVIGDNNVEFLKMLAEELQLSELKHKVEEFETKCSGIFQKAVNVAGRAPGFVWQKFKGGVCTSAIYLKTVLSIKGVQVALAGALLYMYGTNPEKLKDLQPFVEYGTQLVAIFRGSVVFVLKVSSISSLKRLWQSYKDDSLKEKMKKTFNEMKELNEVSHGEEIDVEVTIDEEEYREVLWDLVLLKAKGNSVKTDTKRQRRHSVCCGRDFPEKVGKPMDVTQIQIRVGRPLTELEISIRNIKRLKEALRGKEFVLSRIAEVEEQRLSEIGRQLSEMEIFLAASGFTEIRMKEAEKSSPSEYVTKSIPSVERRLHVRAASGFSKIRKKEAEKSSPSDYVTKSIPSVERRLHVAGFPESKSKNAARHPNLFTKVKKWLTGSSLTSSSEYYQKAEQAERSSNPTQEQPLLVKPQGHSNRPMNPEAERTKTQKKELIHKTYGPRVEDMPRDVMHGVCLMLNPIKNQTAGGYCKVAEEIGLTHYQIKDLAKENPMEDVFEVMVSQAKKVDEFVDILLKIDRGDVVLKIYDMALHG